MVKKVLFLMSDTGGGHRAAAKAITDALTMRYGDVETTMVDVYRQCYPPLYYMPEFYPWIVRHAPQVYGYSFRSSDTPLGSAFSVNSMYWMNGHRLRRMVRDNPADVVVSVHSVITRPSMRAFQAFDRRPPFLTVVTDLVTTHRLWFDTHTDRCFVPTQSAYDRALQRGMRPDQLQLSGLPVNPGFTNAMVGEREAREFLGWRDDKPTILMIGGGEGMGPLFSHAQAINAAQLDCELAIVAGRNTELREMLEDQHWNQPTHIYGFVNNVHDMPLMMKAADVLVTKAGPATISEACIAGLPMILYSAIPGQEEGNVDFVEENQIGTFAPKPEMMVEVLQSWFQKGELQRLAQRALEIAHPGAVWEIADAIWEYAHAGAVPVQV